MKIKKIYIQNFKVFTKATFKFENSHLLVLDGPNGFGKTSLFDAIELLLTGQIRRYVKLGEQTIKGSQTFSEYPFYNQYAENEDLIIKAEIEHDSQLVVLERRAQKSDLSNNHFFNSYKLYIKEDFENHNETLIENEIDYLQELLGKDFKENFEFLNYVEQEDSIYLLKCKDKDKQDSIAYLFNTQEFQNKITQYEEIKKKLLKLCDTPAKAKLIEKENELAELADQLSSSDEVVYAKLFTEQSYEWDKNEISFDVIKYADLLNEDGIITRIKDLINNKLFFLDYQHNNEIEKLIGQSANLEKVLRYQKYLNNKEELTKEKQLQEAQNFFLVDLNAIDIDIVKSDKLFIDPSKLLPKIEVEILSNYVSDLNSLKVSATELTDLATVQNQLNSTRESLSSKFKDFHYLTHSAGECILCGFDWKETDILLENITTQTEKIKTLVVASSGTITQQIQEFKDKYTPIYTRIINIYQIENEIDIAFVNNLITQDDILINSLTHKLELAGVNLNLFLNSSSNMTNVLNTIGLLDTLKNLKKEIPSDIIKSHFSETFTQYFFSNKLNILDFEVETIDKKTKYINWQYSKYQNKNFTLKASELKALQLQVTNASEKGDTIKRVSSVYKESLKKYNQKLINDIEILFHIYSGRIVQDFQGGLGLFISNDKGIKFQTDPSKTYDAIFSMSSGQLSALIISFTLALNKKYSKNNWDKK